MALDDASGGGSDGGSTTDQDDDLGGSSTASSGSPVAGGTERIPADDDTSGDGSTESVSGPPAAGGTEEIEPTDGDTSTEDGTDDTTSPDPPAAGGTEQIDATDGDTATGGGTTDEDNIPDTQAGEPPQAGEFDGVSQDQQQAGGPPTFEDGPQTGPQGTPPTADEGPGGLDPGTGDAVDPDNVPNVSEYDTQAEYLRAATANQFIGVTESDVHVTQTGPGQYDVAFSRDSAREVVSNRTGIPPGEVVFDTQGRQSVEDINAEITEQRAELEEYEPVRQHMVAESREGARVDAGAEARRRRENLQSEFERGAYGDPQEIIAEDAASQLSAEYGFEVRESDVTVQRATGEDPAPGGDRGALPLSDELRVLAGGTFAVGVDPSVREAAALVEEAEAQTPGTVDVSRTSTGEFDVDVTGGYETQGQLGSELEAALDADEAGVDPTPVTGAQTTVQDPTEPLNASTPGPAESLVSVSRDLSSSLTQNVVRPAAAGFGDAVGRGVGVAGVPFVVASGGEISDSRQAGRVTGNVAQQTALGAGEAGVILTAGLPMLASQGYDLAAGSAAYTADQLSEGDPVDPVVAGGEFAYNFARQEAAFARDNPFRYSGQFVAGAALGGLAGRAAGRALPASVTGGRAGQVTRAVVDPVYTTGRVAYGRASAARQAIDLPRFRADTRGMAQLPRGRQPDTDSRPTVGGDDADINIDVTGPDPNPRPRNVDTTVSGQPPATPPQRQSTSVFRDATPPGPNPGARFNGGDTPGFNTQGFGFGEFTTGPLATAGTPQQQRPVTEASVASALTRLDAAETPQVGQTEATFGRVERVLRDAEQPAVSVAELTGLLAADQATDATSPSFEFGSEFGTAGVTVTDTEPGVTTQPSIDDDTRTSPQADTDVTPESRAGTTPFVRDMTRLTPRGATRPRGQLTPLLSPRPYPTPDPTPTPSPSGTPDPTPNRRPTPSPDADEADDESLLDFGSLGAGGRGRTTGADPRPSWLNQYVTALAGGGLEARQSPQNIEELADESLGLGLPTRGQVDPGPGLDAGLAAVSSFFFVDPDEDDGDANDGGVWGWF